MNASAATAELADFLNRWWRDQQARLPRYPPAPEARRLGALDIVIPIHDAFDAVRECLESVWPELSADDQLWLIDDASQDEGLRRALQTWASDHPQVRLRRWENNRGLVHSLNTALEWCERDVLILNSDTRLQPGTVAALQCVLASAADIGIVCPVSDHATLLSLPQPIQPGVAVRATATVHGPRLPTAVGFAMLIRRQLIQRIGDFDPAFSPGYGEENDFSMRARAAGFQIVAADQVTVYHRGGASFAGQKPSLQRDLHRRVLEARWPDYNREVTRYWQANPLSAKPLDALLPAGKPRILHFLHRLDGIGGTERVTHDLLSATADRFQHVLLYPDLSRRDAADCQWSWRQGVLCVSVNLARRERRQWLMGHPADLGNLAIEATVARLFQAIAADVVHFHHLLNWGSWLLPELAVRFGARVVLSWHDLYPLCPNYSQIEYGTRQTCGRVHCLEDERCRRCLHGYSVLRGHPPIPAGYSQARHALIGHALQRADAVLVPSAYLEHRLRDAFGDAIAPLTRVPHRTRPRTTPIPATDGRLQTIGYFGGDNFVKGAGLVIELARRLQDLPIRFLVYGKPDRLRGRRLSPNLQLCGRYSPTQLDALYAPLDLCLIPSHYDETFSLTLSESWERGVPVLASATAALQERIHGSQAGWLLPPGDVAAWEAELRALQRNPQRLVAARTELLSRTASAEQDDPIARYTGLYEQLRQLGPRSPPPQGQARPQPLPAPRHAAALPADLRADLRYRVESPICGQPRRRVRTWIWPTFERRAAPLLQAASTLEADWWLLAEPGDDYRPEVIELLQQHDPHDIDLVCFDASIVDRTGYAYRRWRRAHVEPELATLSADFDHAAAVSGAWLARWLGESRCLESLSAPRLAFGREARIVQYPADLCLRLDSNLVALSRCLLNRQWPALQRAMCEVAPGTRLCVLQDAAPPQWLRFEQGWHPLPAQPVTVEGVLLLAAGIQPSPELLSGLLYWRQRCRADVVAAAHAGGDGTGAGGAHLLLPDRWLPVAALPEARGFEPAAVLPIPRLVSALPTAALLCGAEMFAAAATAAGDDFDYLRQLLSRQLPGRRLLCSQPQVTSPTPTPSPPAAALGRPLAPTASLALATRPLPDPIRRWAFGRPARARVMGLLRDGWAVSQLRIAQPLRALAAAGQIQLPWLHELKSSGMPSLEQLLAAEPDAIVLPPLLHDAGLALIEQLARRSHSRLLLIIDDLWTDLPADSRVHRHFADDDIGPRLHTLARWVDAAIYTTPTLQEQLPLPVAESWVIGHGLCAEHWQPAGPRPAPEFGRLRIGWAGAAQHVSDLELLEPVIAATRHRLDWVFLGHAPARSGLLAQPTVPFEQFPQSLRALQLDIAVAPLLDHRFNRCKSPLKLLEYGMLGVPAVASAVTPYLGTPALLVDNQPEAWIAAVLRLADDANARAEAASTLASWVQQDGLIQHRLPQWRAALAPDQPARIS